MPTTTPAIDEEALMEAYVNGDRAAFDALFTSLSPRLHGFFVRRFGNSAVADDLLQTTFMKVHRARRDYRFGAPLRPWVFTIAARVGLDEMRRRGRRPEDANETKLDRATNALSMEQEDASQILERADVAKRVQDALDKLPETQRVVIDLHRYQGLTFSEIAERLGTTEGAIKLRAFRVYERLRKELRPLMQAISTGEDLPAEAEADATDDA